MEPDASFLVSRAGWVSHDYSYTFIIVIISLEVISCVGAYRLHEEYLSCEKYKE